MSEHTPGPWKWGITMPATYPKMVSLGSSVVSRQVLLHQANWDITPADRALIAAAPELYREGEAFNKAAWILVTELMGQDDWTVDDADQSPFAQKMRQFLAASAKHMDAINNAAGAPE